MAENSKIQWTTHTFNCWRGCTKVSDGCKHCYAETLSHRNPATLGVWGPNGTRVLASENAWKQPLKWDANAKAAGGRHRVFCASLADVFEDWAGQLKNNAGDRLWFHPSAARREPFVCRNASQTFEAHDDFAPYGLPQARDRLFQLIAATPNLDWLLLTKRPKNAATMLPFHAGGAIGFRMNHGLPNEHLHAAAPSLPNIWIGTSVEDQVTADERIPKLLAVPGRVRFLSIEPLLGPVDLRRGVYSAGTKLTRGTTLEGIDWVIIGGESGHDARPCNLDWIRSIMKQCQAAGVAVFVKQLGANLRGYDERCWKCGRADWGAIDHGPRSHPGYENCNICGSNSTRCVDLKGGDPAEWPEDLRIRQFPRGA